MANLKCIYTAIMKYDDAVRCAAASVAKSARVLHGRLWPTPVHDTGVRISGTGGERKKNVNELEIIS